MKYEDIEPCCWVLLKSEKWPDMNDWHQVWDGEMRLFGREEFVAACPNKPEPFDPKRLRKGDRVLIGQYSESGEPFWERVSDLAFWLRSTNDGLWVDYCAPREEKCEHSFVGGHTPYCSKCGIYWWIDHAVEGTDRSVEQVVANQGSTSGRFQALEPNTSEIKEFTATSTGSKPKNFVIVDEPFDPRSFEEWLDEQLDKVEWCRAPEGCIHDAPYHLSGTPFCSKHYDQRSTEGLYKQHIDQHPDRQGPVRRYEKRKLSFWPLDEDEGV